MLAGYHQFVRTRLRPTPAEGQAAHRLRIYRTGRRQSRCPAPGVFLTQGRTVTRRRKYRQLESQLEAQPSSRKANSLCPAWGTVVASTRMKGHAKVWREECD